MWLCKECGYTNDGVKICKRCGASKEQSESAYVAGTFDPDKPRELTRYETNKELKRLDKYFAPMESVYDEYDYCNQKLDFLDKKGFVPIGVAIYGLITIALAVWMIILICLKSFKLYNGLIIWMLMYVGLGVYCVVEYRRSLKDNRKKIKKYLGREVELAKQLTNHFNDYGTCLLGAEYTNPKIIDKLMQIFDSGRADSLEEAIQMLYVESGRTEEENKNRLDLVGSRQIEFGAKEAKVFCASSFFGLYNKKQDRNPFRYLFRR